jgi:hypothetical protein
LAVSFTGEFALSCRVREKILPHGYAWVDSRTKV